MWFRSFALLFRCRVWRFVQAGLKILNMKQSPDQSAENQGREENGDLFEQPGNGPVEIHPGQAQPIKCQEGAEHRLEKSLLPWRKGFRSCQTKESAENNSGTIQQR